VMPKPNICGIKVMPRKSCPPQEFPERATELLIRSVKSNKELLLEKVSKTQQIRKANMLCAYAGPHRRLSATEHITRETL
jgi:hypothetical protein